MITELIHLRKIWHFHGGDYEECRLLGYKNPVRTSQRTHYVSATDPMLCRIWGFHGGDDEECRLEGYYDVSEEFFASIIRVTRIGELGTTLTITSNRSTLPILATLMMEAIRSSETSVLARATQRKITEGGILNRPSLKWDVVSQFLPNEALH
jgi:hypothetical protein